MRLYILFLFCTYLFFTGTVSAQSGMSQKKLFNWGVRIGVNAPFVDMRKSQINGIKIEEPSTNSKMGILISLFARTNFNKHYLQLEAETHYMRYRMSPRPESVITDGSTGYMEGITVGNRIYSLDIPLLYGYNFIKQGPYELSFLPVQNLNIYIRKRANSPHRKRMNLSWMNTSVR